MTSFSYVGELLLFYFPMWKDIFYKLYSKSVCSLFIFIKYFIFVIIQFQKWIFLILVLFCLTQCQQYIHHI